jgi:hypothetical protein
MSTLSYMYGNVCPNRAKAPETKDKHMAANRSRGLRMRCAFCNKGAFVSISLKDKRIDLCSNHIEALGCKTENHSGYFHSVDCRYIKEAI